MRFIRLVAFFVFLICFHKAAYGVWQKVGQFSDAAGCGYFFDANNGIIGLGHFSVNNSLGSFVSNSPLQIFWTSDGGLSWNLATIPSGGTGRVTSIFMKDRTIGFAAIYSNIYSLWKTTDGGKSWFDISQGNLDLTTCIYASNMALTKTIWFGKPGGASFDGGRTFSQVFTGSDRNGSDGVDFSGNDGVATAGPGGGSWFTNDGGVTWNPGGDLPESWSVYAQAGTRLFFALPEDFGSSGKTVYWCQSAGSSWMPGFVFQDAVSFTGHIAGVGNTLYVQTEYTSNQGLFRSDDLGKTWVNVGGPSNTRDTRFVVTGCRGEVVYAFDNNGGVWKTTDGGDGTLTGSSGGSGILTLAKDSLYIETHYCQPGKLYVDLINSGCNSITIDTIIIAPNPFKEFSVDTIQRGITILSLSNSVGIPITFHTDSNVTRHATIHIQAHSGTTIIDTIIILVAKHSTAPEPYLDSFLTKKAGDTVLVPIFLRQTKDSFQIKNFSFTLSYNGDILTPAQQSVETFGTLSNGATTTLVPLQNGVYCSAVLSKPITQNLNLLLPLIYLRMGVTLSRSMTCQVLIDSFSISTNTPLPLCNIPALIFAVDPECGDTTISKFIKTGDLPQLLSIVPNPSQSQSIEARIFLPSESEVWADLIGNNGSYQSLKTKEIYQKGIHDLVFPTIGISSGEYFLKIHLQNGSYLSGRIVITR